MLVCDKCSGKITDGARFCPHCGDPVTEADLPESAVTRSSAVEVEISFGSSTSASFDHAVTICSNIPSYISSGEGKTARHTIVLPITEVELLINIWELVGSWKSAKMLINGQPATKSKLVYKGAGCFRSRQRAFSREQYCFGEHEYEFNIWGCKKLDMPISQWGGGWLEYGKLDSKGVWHFDHARIRHELEVAIHENELCPVLDRKSIIETLEQLPRTIDPKEDMHWEYRTNYEEVRGDYRDVAVGIRPVLKCASRYVIGEYEPEWKSENSGDPESDRQFVTLQGECSPPRRKNKSGCLAAVSLLAFLILVMILALT